MRVLIATGIFPPEIGGPATYALSLSRWLQENGHRVTVVTALKGEPHESYPFAVAVVKKRGVFLWHIKIFFRIFKLLKGVDILYINGLLFESVSAALLRGKKCIYRVPGDLVWERAVRKKWTDKSFADFQEQGEKGNIKVRLLRAYRRFCLNRVDKVITPSLFLARVVETWGAARTRTAVVANPFHAVEAEGWDLPAACKGKFIITTGGRLVSWKGIGRVIRALKKINGSFLVLPGSGPERENLEKLVKDLQIEERVYFTGAISRPHIQYLFSQSGCFVLNSRYEGLPHIVLEAMAVGCPVIASNIGGSPEIIRHKKNGFLIEPDDEAALLGYIASLKSDRDLRERLSKAAQRTVRERFNRERLFRQVEAIMQECIGERK